MPATTASPGMGEEGIATLAIAAVPEAVAPLLAQLRQMPATLWVWIEGEGHLVTEVDWPGGYVTVTEV